MTTVEMKELGKILACLCVSLGKERWTERAKQLEYTGFVIKREMPNIVNSINDIKQVNYRISSHGEEGKHQVAS